MNWKPSRVFTKSARIRESFFDPDSHVSVKHTVSSESLITESQRLRVLLFKDLAFQRAKLEYCPVANFLFGHLRLGKSTCIRQDWSMEAQVGIGLQFPRCVHLTGPV